MVQRDSCDYIKIEKKDLVKKKLNQRKYINQLKREIRCLERANKTCKNAETELETWKERYKEKEEELEAYRMMNINGLVQEKKLDRVVVEADKAKGKVIVNDELNDYRIKCGKLQERITLLEEDQILCSLSENDKFVQLETENKELEIGKCRLQDEMNVCEKVMEACTVKSNELSALLEEKKMECVVLEDKFEDLRLSKLRIDDELNGYKGKCSKLEERITQLESDRRVIREKEKLGQERILHLLSENDKLVQLETENRELKLRIGRLQDEIGACQKELGTYAVSSTGLSVLLGEKDANCVLLENKVKDLSLRKVLVDEELNECKAMCIELKEQVARLEKEKNFMFGREKRARETIAEMSAKIKVKGSDGKEEYLKLKAAYVDLERGKHNSQEEIRTLRKSIADSNSQAALRLAHEVELQKNLDDCKFQFSQLSEKLEERASIEAKLSEGLKKASDATEMWKERFGEMKKESEAYRCKCDELSLKLEEKIRECLAGAVKLNGLISRKNSADSQLHEYKKTSDVLKERISCFEAEQKVICETKKRAEEKIANLSEELKKTRDESIMWKEMCEEMKTKTEAFICKCGVIDEREKVSQLKEELAVCRTMSQEAPLEPEKKIIQFVANGCKLEAFALTENSVDNELNECKTMCNELKERVARLEKDKHLMAGKEKRSQERITELSAEIKKKESDGKAEYVKLKAACADLERGKLNSQEEIRMLRKSLADLKSQASSWLTYEAESQKFLDDCKLECNQLSLKLDEKSREFLASEAKLKDLTLRNDSVYYELSEYKKASDVLEERISQLGEDLKAIHETEKWAQVKIIHLSEELKTAGEEIVAWKEMCEDMKKESEACRCKGGELSLNLEEKKWESGKYDVIYETENAVQQSITTFCEENLIKKCTSGLNCLQYEVSHKDDENKDNSHVAVTGVSSVNMICKTLTNVGSEKNIPIVIEPDDIIDISDEDELQPPKKRFKRPLPGQRCDEDWSSLKEDSPVSSITKRKWVSSTGTSEQAIEDDINMTKSNAGKDDPKHFSMMRCSRTRNVSFGGQHVEETKGWSRWTEGKTLNHLEMSGSLHEKVGNTTFMSDTQNVLNDVCLNGGSKNLGAYMVEGDSHMAFNQIEFIQDNGSNWKFEADMLSSFEEDPELCMKAVCALYRQQTLKEKSKQDPLGCNLKHGFRPFHAFRGTELAEFLMDGDREGSLKKSVEDLNLFDRNALDDCKTLAKDHSDQLFRLYKAKEDPFFLPS